ncbi:HEAT repeat domain-containing protein [Nocardia sp. NPDC049707]|uniref:HEAT repeat domain-containing protein n=1 Tax=Nocardia sp. NPDC049707 TaxID=3154735 RepID=UPI0034162EEE
MITGIRVQHITGEVVTQSGGPSGARPPDALYAFPFEYRQKATHDLEPTLVINPADRDTIHFDLWLYPKGGFPSGSGRLCATLLYHLPGGEQGELPIERLDPQWRLFARVSGKPIPIRFSESQGVSYVMSSGALRGTAPTVRDAGRVRSSDDFDPHWLVDPAYAAQLRESTADVDPAVRKAAVWALGELGDAEGLAAILQTRWDDEGNRMHKMLQAVEKIAETADASSAVEALLPLLEARRAVIRQRVALTLGKLGDPKATPALVTALLHENTRVPRLEQNRDSERSWVRLRCSYRYIEGIYGWYYVNNGHDELEEFSEEYILESEDEGCNDWFAGDWFAGAAHVCSKTELLADEAVCLSAAKALIALHDTSVVPELTRLRDHPDSRVRTAVAYALDGLLPRRD